MAKYVYNFGKDGANFIHAVLPCILLLLLIPQSMLWLASVSWGQTAVKQEHVDYKIFFNRYQIP